MSLHIVTSKCFLTCEKITFIKVEEFLVEESRAVPKIKKKGYPPKKTVKPEMNYRITIGYFPIVGASGTYSNNREPNECLLELSLFDKQKATTLYMEIVKEVQEQFPHEVYLDKLVSNMLLSDEFKIELPVKE